MFQNIMSIDQNIIIWIQDSWRNDVLTPIFIFITKLGDNGAIWILISLGLLIPKKTRKIGLMSLLALALSVIIDNMLLKNIVARVRPYEVVPRLHSLIGIQNDYSFPSGHTGSSFAAAVIMFCGLPKKYGVLAIVLATLIGFSRLYVGVHYPTDVLCGAFIGAGIALLTYMLGNSLMERRKA